MNASAFRCLVTAGPTREWMDPVRFLSNPSSGKMGYALARAARNRGWKVNLVSGPVSLKVPAGVTPSFVETALEMRDECAKLFPSCNMLLMSAAVCDHRPKNMVDQKIKKSRMTESLELESNPDILSELGSQKAEGQILVGFAAETADCEANALSKMHEKNLDWIVLNEVGLEGGAFGSDDNSVTLFGKNGSRQSFGSAGKLEIANALLDSIVS